MPISLRHFTLSWDGSVNYYTTTVSHGLQELHHTHAATVSPCGEHTTPRDRPPASARLPFNLRLLLLLLLLLLLNLVARCGSVRLGCFAEHGLVDLNLYPQGLVAAAPVEAAHRASVQVIETHSHAYMTTARAHLIGHVESLPPRTFDPCLGPGVTSHFLALSIAGRGSIQGREIATDVAGGNVQLTTA